MLSEMSSTKLRKTIGVTGIISVIMGLLILLWPGRTAEIASLLVGISFLLTGILTLWHAYKMPVESGFSRIGQFILGALNIIVGLFMFVNLTASTALLFIFVGIFTGLAWIVDGFIAFSQMKL
ncbi:MAG: DUF308 domain-containing protein, partial [Lactovum sp.]